MYCVDGLTDLKDELEKDNSIVERGPGRSISSPIGKMDGVPVDNLHRVCRCPKCAAETRGSSKTDARRRSELEMDIEVKCLKRPYRCTYFVYLTQFKYRSSAHVVFDLLETGAVTQFVTYVSSSFQEEKEKVHPSVYGYGAPHIHHGVLCMPNFRTYDV